MESEINEEDDIIELNNGHIHEAIDRIYVATVYLNSVLSEHSLIDSVDEFRNQVDKSIEILAELYQTIGSLDSLTGLTDKYALRKGYKIKN